MNESDASFYTMNCVGKWSFQSTRNIEQSQQSLGGEALDMSHNLSTGAMWKCNAFTQELTVNRLEVIYEMFHILNCGITRSRVQTLLKSWLFQTSMRNCLNCVHNWDDYSLLELIDCASGIQFLWQCYANDKWFYS